MKTVYKKLSEPIEEKYIIEYQEEGKTFKGYNAQAAINRLNDVFGIDGWAVKYSEPKVELVNKAWAAYITVEITFRDDYEETKSPILGIPLLKEEISKVGSGGAYAKNIANAVKGARTSAFKNACRYLGIGKELYEQNIDEDIIEIEEEKSTSVTIPPELELLEQKIKSAKTIEQLQSLEDKVKEVEEKSVQKIIYDKYNARKIELLT